MLAFPAAAALTAAACAAFVGWDAVRRPRADRTIWSVAFLVFAIAASAEVLGAVTGWTPTLARVYYLAGAVLVVGILALGELYLLWPGRLPAVTPGIALLVVAIAATAVWSAPVNSSLVAVQGWHAIERGPFLVALAATINAAGTLVLVGGALNSAATIRQRGGSGRRTTGCVLIALGTIVVALGGTLTRFGQPEYLYLAMSAGIATIFAGVLLTRSPVRQAETRPFAAGGNVQPRYEIAPVLVARESQRTAGQANDGLRFVTEHLLPLPAEDVADACRRWSATPIAGDALTRDQARLTWALRIGLTDDGRVRFDRLPLSVQAQLGELYGGVWNDEFLPASDGTRAASPRQLAIIRPATEAEGEAR